LAVSRTRLSLVEYGSPIDLSKQIIEAIGVDQAWSNQILIDAGIRAARSLGLSNNPISIDSRGARAIDFAGLIRLAPSLELEVAPKFLGIDKNDESWREDFFFLSTLSRHGHLLASEKLSASGGAPRDLSTLVARSITSMYEALKRRPLRSYRRVKESDFFIDGDPDPTDLIFPGPDGFEQEIIRFDRRNEWNADICAAARELLPEVTDPSTVGSLVRLIEDLSPQGKVQRRRKAIPSRHHAWQPLHELSRDVLDDLGLNYTQGHLRAPGYLIATWRVWEDLLTVGARLGFGSAAISAQQGFALGTKHKLIKSMNSSTISVVPDCVIEGDGARPRMLLDAKYKGHIEKGSLRITEADIYEALAFSKAAGCNHVVLAYPAQPAASVRPVGTCSAFERIEVGDVKIIGIQVETKAISKPGALKLFADTMANHLSNLFV
jgi:5-methylcytosine-specific restriction endonuclease McrBC regulatory subunit McrC